MGVPTANSRFSGIWPTSFLAINHLPCENRRTVGRIGEDGLSWKWPCRDSPQMNVKPRKRKVSATAIRSTRAALTTISLRPCEGLFKLEPSLIEEMVVGGIDTPA
jgi:hypothetical protein